MFPNLLNAGNSMSEYQYFIQRKSMPAVSQFFLHRKFHQFLGQRGHIFVPLTERHYRKSHDACHQ